MSLEISFFRKKTSIIILHFLFFFVYLLLIFINEFAHNTLWVFYESAIEHILGAKVWLYGFQIISGVLIDF